MAYLEKGLKMYPQFKSGWVYMGYAQRALNDYKGSRESFEKVLKLMPTDADAIKALDFDSHECFKNGDTKQAILNVETLIKYVPDNLQYFYLKAEIYENLAMPDSCVSILNHILAINPKYDKALNKLGEIYGRDYNDLAKSMEYLEKAYAANPGNPDVLKNLGTASGLKGRYDEALKYLLEAEKGLPDSKEVLSKIAISYQNLGDTKKASEYIQKANNAKGK
jgi:tetratricopeptide (TPR) repeat protein